MTIGNYLLRGVSSAKEDVHNAIKNLDRGIYPNTFCKILPDILGGNKNYCNILHADGAGTKPVIAYLHWKEFKELEIWKGIVQDALVMNLDDLLCAGATGPFLLSSVIGRNKHKIEGDVIRYLINATSDLINDFKKLGIKITLAGGETEDVGDVVRTLSLNFTLACRMKRKDVIPININPGDVIIGLSSSGVTKYDKNFNSGIGCNGLTSARHDFLAKKYGVKYPESFNPEIPEKLIYSGSHSLNPISSNVSPDITNFLLSPTRTYAPLLRDIFTLGRKKINGIIHCTGGGQTKVLHFIKNLHIIKNNLFPIPPVFRLIQEQSQAQWEEMYKVFNMGHRMEIYTHENFADVIIRKSNNFGINAQIIGNVEKYKGKKLTISSEFGNFVYN